MANVSDGTVSATGAGVALNTEPGGIRRFLTRSETFQGYILLSPTLLVVLVALAVPIALTIRISFATQNVFDIEWVWTLENYAKIVNYADWPIYMTLIGRSMWISGSTTILTVLLAYPMAYYVAIHVQRNKLIWIILMTLPFWSSYLLRVFAWKIILGYQGVINSSLIELGLIEEPLSFLMYNPFAVIVTLSHAWAAFAILPMYVSLEKIDKALLEAATDLGDSPWQRFFRVTLPLSMPGVSAAVLMIFIPTIGDYVTPALVGGQDGLMVANLIQMQFGRANNWPLGAALALFSMVVVTCISVGYLLLSRKAMEKIG